MWLPDHQFSEGLSTWSITRMSIGPFVGTDDLVSGESLGWGFNFEPFFVTSNAYTGMSLDSPWLFG
jgi:hypothetical protein